MITSFLHPEEHFNGIEPITGNIKLDANGDRENSFLFWHLDNNGEWEVCQNFIKYTTCLYIVSVSDCLHITSATEGNEMLTEGRRGSRLFRPLLFSKI